VASKGQAALDAALGADDGQVGLILGPERLVEEGLGPSGRET